MMLMGLFLAASLLFLLKHTNHLLVDSIFVKWSANDGGDDHCEQLGWKKLQEYNPAQRCWKYLSTLAEGSTTLESDLPFKDELEEEDYYPSLSFAALFSCLKAKGLKVTCLLCYCSEGDNIQDAFYFLYRPKILDDPSPSPPKHKFSPEFCSFIDACLQKDADA